MVRYERQRIALRYWLLGAQYFTALDALDFAGDYHRGTRKDGVTPEFSHQIAIAHYVRTLVPHLDHPEEAIAAAVLHDVCEDYDVEHAVLEARFGPIVAAAVRAMTKEHKGVRFDEGTVFAAIAADAVASVVKAADRIHNQSTMVGVFSPAKVASYVEETTTWFFPMLKAARRRFPRQEGAYENAKLVLESQVQLLAHLSD